MRLGMSILYYNMIIILSPHPERQTSPPPSWNDFIVPVIGVAAMVTMATMAGLAIYHLNQARKKGSYELAKSTARGV